METNICRSALCMVPCRNVNTFVWLHYPFKQLCTQSKIQVFILSFQSNPQCYNCELNCFKATIYCDAAVENVTVTNICLFSLDI